MTKGVVIGIVTGLLVAGLLTLWGCGGGGESYSTVVIPSKKVVGIWNYETLTVALNADGSFDSVDPVNGIDVVGAYSTIGNRLIITDTGGTSSCAPEGAATGSYTYSIDNDNTTMTLKKVKDNCPGRATSLDGKTLVRVDIVGTWNNDSLNISFNSDGSFNSSDGISIDVNGTYKISGTELILTDTGGTSSCALEEAATGHYRILFSGGGTALTFEVLSDECEGRVSALVDKTFDKLLPL